MNERHTMDLVYLDFAKAFDSFSHRFRIAKLKSSGIDEIRLNWIKSYLSDRSYQVQIDGVLSKEAPCLSGIPQRSAISPPLFRLAVLGDSAFLFADDVKILFPQSQLSHLLSSLSFAWT